MRAKTHRLDRFISQNTEFTQGDVRLLIAQQRVVVDGQLAQSIRQQVTQFSSVLLDGQCLQDNQPVYLMLNKPRGVVSATKDQQHSTVLDLIAHRQTSQLHIVGRLDLNTTGMLLLTNDGAWSRKISLPESKLTKTYAVTVAQPLTAEYIACFRQGIYFAYEDSTTQPADLEILSAYRAQLTLTEGKYHQVKRMFGYFRNQVLALHRSSVGPLQLDGLELGQSRELTQEELRAVEQQLPF